ncbi:tRNA pseudouridine synthase A [Salinimicrobium sp. GXAS 041]|uniref:tRNA pseudouridine synthase A n=1 Tax=Salinimicrobium sp. GXAS 041 TaxID=3400806 RepID=UPI003C72CF94
MQRQRYYYLIEIQYLGYRLHGWQRQPGLKTIEGLIKKTLKFILEDTRFKILGAGRTDAMVSASQAAFELFIDEQPLNDLHDFLKEFNRNLPQDIRALKIKEVDEKFNIIQHPKTKEYVYLFAFGKKSHPFCAPLLATFPEELDVALMMKGASCFEGFHNFRNYCTRPTEHTIVEREITKCEIVKNDIITANFFPEESYALKICGKGFLRNQIRLIMGALVLLGRSELDLEDIKRSLKAKTPYPMTYIAPGSGLILNRVEFE